MSHVINYTAIILLLLFVGCKNSRQFQGKRANIRIVNMQGKRVDVMRRRMPDYNQEMINIRRKREEEKNSAGLQAPDLSRQDENSKLHARQYNSINSLDNVDGRMNNKRNLSQNTKNEGLKVYDEYASIVDAVQNSKKLTEKPNDNLNNSVGSSTNQNVSPSNDRRQYDVQSSPQQVMIINDGLDKIKKKVPIKSKTPNTQNVIPNKIKQSDNKSTNQSKTTPNPSNSSKKVQGSSDNEVILMNQIGFGYFVRAGAFAEQKIASDILKALRQFTNAAMYIVYEQDTMLRYKIMLGPFSERNDANDVIIQLKNHGYTDVLIVKR